MKAGLDLGFEGGDAARGTGARKNFNNEDEDDDEWDEENGNEDRGRVKRQERKEADERFHWSAMGIYSFPGGGGFMGYLF